MAKINEYPLERFTFGDDDYYDIDYWDGAVYQSAKIKGSTIRAAMSGGGSILAADGQVMPADRSQDLANFKLSLRDGVFTLGTVDADFGSIFQATKDSGNTYATIKTKTNDNAALILDINTADVTGAGNKTAFIQFRDAGVSKYIFGTNTDGVANFSDNSFFISSSALLTDYIQAIDRNTESFVIGRQIGNPLNDNTKFLINNGNSFDTTELDNVLMLSSRDESKKWFVDKDMFFSATKIKGADATAGNSVLRLYNTNTPSDELLWDFRNNGDIHQNVSAVHYLNGNTLTFEGNATFAKFSNTEAATTSGQKVLELNAKVVGTTIGSGAIIDVISSGSLNTGRIHNYTFGGGNVGWRLYSWDGTSGLGDSFLAQDVNAALIGRNVTSRIGTEDISLQGDVLIQSTGTGSVLKISNTGAATTSGQKVLELNAEAVGTIIGSGAIIDVISNGSLNTGRIHNYTFGGGNVGWRLYSWDGTSGLGDSFLAQDVNAALIGRNVTSRIGTEDISLQGDVLMNANVNIPNLPTSSVGLSAGDLWNDAGTLKVV